MKQLMKNASIKIPKRQYDEALENARALGYANFSLYTREAIRHMGSADAVLRVEERIAKALDGVVGRLKRLEEQNEALYQLLLGRVTEPQKEPSQGVLHLTEVDGPLTNSPDEDFYQSLIARLAK